MNFDKESKSEDLFLCIYFFNFFFFFFFWGGGGGGRVWTRCFRLFFVLRLYIKFQVLGLSGSLVLTQTKGVTER